MRHQSLFIFLILGTISAYTVSANDIEYYRAVITGLYEKTLNDPATSWFTKAFMRRWPVQVVAVRDPFLFLGRCGDTTIEMNVEALARVSDPDIPLCVATHEFMHYKHCHGIISPLFGVPIIMISTILGVATAWYLKPWFDHWKAQYHKKLQDNNAYTRWRAQCVDMLFTAALWSIPLTSFCGGMLGALRLISHFDEFQADASAARLTKLFAPMIRMRLGIGVPKIDWTNASKMQKLLLKMQELLVKLAYPSRTSCVNNLVNVAAQDKLQELLVQEPTASYTILKARALQWAQSLIPAIT